MEHKQNLFNNLAFENKLILNRYNGGEAMSTEDREIYLNNRNQLEVLGKELYHYRSKFIYVGKAVDLGPTN
jgi:hypothetical protein